MSKKEFISNFIESVVLKDSVSNDVLSDFLKLDGNSTNDDYKLIKSNIEFLKTELNEQDYSILTYNEFKNKKEFNDYQVHYKYVDKLYCIVVENKFITLIVIDDDKIISFFTGIIKNKNRIFPYIINEP